MTKKEKIMTSAIRLFCSLGFQHTSTTKITKDAGVGTGTLFLYFKSKDDLVNKLYLEIKREMQIYHQVFKNDQLSFKAQMNAFWKDIVQWGLDNPEKFKFMMQFQNSPYISQLTIEEINEEKQFIRDVMQRAIDDKIIIDQPYEFLVALFTSQFSSIIQYLSTQDTAPEKALIQTSFDVLWNGIKK